MPELTVLYEREAAIGLGHDEDHLAVNGQPVRALQTASADVAGLLNFVAAHGGRLQPEQQAIFRDLERLGRDLRSRGSEGPNVESRDFGI